MSWAESLALIHDAALEASHARTFGSAWELVEVSSLFLRRQRLRPADLPREIRAAREGLKELKSAIDRRLSRSRRRDVVGGGCQSAKGKIGPNDRPNPMESLPNMLHNQKTMPEKKSTKEELVGADVVRMMNTYYSNLIEGHNTRPKDIERPLWGKFDDDEQRGTCRSRPPRMYAFKAKSTATAETGCRNRLRSRGARRDATDPSRSRIPTMRGAPTQLKRLRAAGSPAGRGPHHATRAARSWRPEGSDRRA